MGSCLRNCPRLAEWLAAPSCIPAHGEREFLLLPSLSHQWPDFCHSRRCAVACGFVGLTYSSVVTSCLVQKQHPLIPDHYCHLTGKPHACTRHGPFWPPPRALPPPATPAHGGHWLVSVSRGPPIPCTPVMCAFHFMQRATSSVRLPSPAYVSDPSVMQRATALHFF